MPLQGPAKGLYSAQDLGGEADALSHQGRQRTRSHMDTQGQTLGSSTLGTVNSLLLLTFGKYSLAFCCQLPSPLLSMGYRNYGDRSLPMRNSVCWKSQKCKQIQFTGVKFPPSDQERGGKNVLVLIVSVTQGVILVSQYHWVSSWESYPPSLNNSPKSEGLQLIMGMGFSRYQEEGGELGSGTPERWQRSHALQTILCNVGRTPYIFISWWLICL